MNIICLNTKETGNTLTPHFNVYTDSSKISLDEVWSRIRSHYTNQTYSSPMLGKGTVEQTPFRCTLCHGVDHPQGLCPCPNTPDWNGLTRDGNGECRNSRAWFRPLGPKRPISFLGKYLNSIPVPFPTIEQT